MPKENLNSTLDRATGSNGAQPAPAPALGEIGFVGLGRMGSAMAANLAVAGRRVTAYVRHPDQVAKLAALGVTATTDRAKLFACDIVVTMLPDDDAVHEVVFGREGVAGLVSGLKPGAIHLSMSTISTAAAARFAQAHALYGQRYVAAPVFGNPDVAKAHELYVIAAGDADDIDRCRSIFDAIGQKTYVIGADPGQANLVKLMGNMMSATALEVLAEVVAVALKRGLDPKVFIDIMTNTMFSGRTHRTYGDKIVRRNYRPGFTLPLVSKDVRLALAEAERAGAPLPSVGVVRDRLISGMARGHGDLDWTALGLIAEEEAGFKPALSTPTTV